MKQRIRAVSSFLQSKGFSHSRADKIAEAAVRGFKIAHANVLHTLRLVSHDGWTIVCVDDQPGEVTFGELKERVNSN